MYITETTVTNLTYILIHLYVHIFKRFVQIIHQSMPTMAKVVPNACLREQKTWKDKVKYRHNESKRKKETEHLYKHFTCSVVRPYISHAFL